jgi:TRAP transporter TAXI family solute receptor
LKAIHQNQEKEGEMMKRSILIIGTIFLCVTFCVGHALAQEKWALGCSGAGSGPYVWGAAMSKYLNKHQNAVRFSAQASAGYNENVALVSAGTMEVGQQALSGLMDAYNGRMAFKGQAHKRLRLLFPFCLVPYHLVTREASNIKTIYDLKGKKMNIGLPAQITRTENEFFLQAANIKLGDIKKFEMATGQTFKALQNGVIDTTGNFYSSGHGRLLELANNTKIRLVSIPEDVVGKLNKMRGHFPLAIPANTYKGQAYTVKTFGLTNVLFVRDDLSEELVYEVTKAFWDNFPKLIRNPAFKELRLSHAYSDKVAVPYHPGALRYYKKIRLLK